MSRRENSGLTLVELLIASTVLGMITVAASGLMMSALRMHERGESQSELYREGMVAMERMTHSIRTSTFVLIPNAHNTTRDLLVVTGTINEDDDYFFDDELFPRIDEDPDPDYGSDLKSGIETIDDDGDGLVDEGGVFDNDEDGSLMEDPIDGMDNDGDGNIDEDAGADITSDGANGIKYMDDDGDGTVDEFGFGNMDDDEDGVANEDSLNPVLYQFDGGARSLKETTLYTGDDENLSNHVTAFQTVWEAPQRILVQLTLTGDDGQTIQFSEYAFPRNVYQWNGKRVK